MTHFLVDTILYVCNICASGYYFYTQFSQMGRKIYSSSKDIIFTWVTYYSYIFLVYIIQYRGRFNSLCFLLPIAMAHEVHIVFCWDAKDKNKIYMCSTTGYSSLVWHFTWSNIDERISMLTTNGWRLNKPLSCSTSSVAIAIKISTGE